MSGIPSDVLIVGGGIAGYTTATTLREFGYDGPVTIVERDAACSDRPPLSKRVLLEGSPRSEIDFATPERLAELRITVIAGVSATAVTTAGVLLSDGRVLRADSTVIAIGAEARRPSMPGAADHRVTTLRGYDDAMRIRAASGPGRTVLVLGGGFIGAEVAASLRTRQTSVVLVDPHEIPGARTLGTTLAGWLRDMHVAQGVDLRATTVSAIHGDENGAGPLSVALADGSVVEADLVVAGLGVAPQALPGIDLVPLSGGIVLAPTAHWDDARLDGADAAARLLGRDPQPRGAGWYWTDRYGSHIEVVGDLTGRGEDVRRARTSVFRIEGDRLMGAASIDDPMTVRAARRIIDRGVRVDPAVLADPAVSLRQMLRG
ncbi:MULTISPECIES: FAD-dependent oxidoreductase [unclassified Microbacterium]|uniref:NAD(P)/FAD-dependent oxidoreductase n=1 Tax=unclassified Microbacterium TaxID=2609290 RepID=UPI001D2C25E8|nr:MULTISPECIES: FAD-dependent oxidoreductase [unclassified Microbacterium]MBT9605193.1 FAD-dependent oxidoreductase [Microbacterium sp.]CAH0239319.1 Benzene 1,2-dioxygenase system ferredoxin--NAD(+) reductase subunit [Microbacterium sp. Bi128]